MANEIRCTACGLKLKEPVGPCPFCGGLIEVLVKLEGQEVAARAGHLGAVTQESTSSGGERIKYSAPTTAKSDSSLAGDSFRATVEAPVDVGRRGESDVLARVLGTFKGAGRNAQLAPAEDSSGEDGVICFEQEKMRITVQIVAPKFEKNFWRNVAAGREQIDADLATVAQWIHSAITTKSTQYAPTQKAAMLLAVDVRHMGVVATPAFVTLYLEQYGDLSGFGFGEVWLIGPTEERCIRLGDSRWWL